MAFGSLEMTFEEAFWIRPSFHGDGTMSMLVPAMVVCVEYDVDGGWDITEVAIMTTDEKDVLIFWDVLSPGKELNLTAEDLAWRHRLAIDDEVAEALRAEGIEPELPKGPSHRERV